jgi:hypothetical protein
MNQLANIWQDQFREDYEIVAKYAKKFPNNNQNSYGPGWNAIPIKFRGKFSKLSKKLGLTRAFCDHPSINTAVFAVLYPGTFVNPNDNIYGENQTIYHFPIISPIGDVGLKLEKDEFMQKWKDGEVIQHKGDDMYCAWNFTRKPRVILHLTVQDDYDTSRSI